MHRYASRLTADNRGALHRERPLSVSVLLLVSTLTLAGCDLIVDIFQAGVWVGVILVVLVIGGIVWFLTKKA
jgi:hypothetical protein